MAPILNADQKRFRGFLLREISPYLEIIDEALSLDPPHVAVAREKLECVKANVQAYLASDTTTVGQ